MALLVVAPRNLLAVAGGVKWHPYQWRNQGRKNAFIFLSSLGLFPKPFVNKLSHLKSKSICSCLRNENAKMDSEEDEEEEFRVLIAVSSKYNDIMIVDTPTSRFLLLDSTHNVHSVVNKGGEKWTGSYWDEFASLPAIVPQGPIAIYGLGGGTAAHLILESWPSLQLEGWEIDEILIDKAREYLGLSDLERLTQAGGRLLVRIDDALSPLEDVSTKYAGIIIDLFSNGKVLTELQEVATWFDLSKRLMPNGRLMVNCGDIDGASDAIDGKPRLKLPDATWVQNSTVKALSQAFPLQVSWKRMPESQGQNFLALTGGFPDLASWSAAVPSCLSESVKQWKPCEPLP